MAIRLFRIVVLILAVLLLGSCNVLQFIFGSVFPATLALVKAQADLSKLIAANSGSSFNLRVVETGTTGYVVVSGSVQGSAPSMFFYDLDLKPKLSLTGATAPAGTGVMADGNGQIKAGGTLYSPDLLTSTAGGPVISGNFGSGVDGFILANPTLDDAVDISITPPNTLTFQHYQNAWTFLDTHSYALSASPTSLQLYAVLDDGNPAGSVIFVVGQSQSGGNGDSFTGYFVSISKSYMVSTSIASFEYTTAPRRDNLTQGTLGFANGSIFAYDSKASSLVRINPADASTQNSLPLGSNNKGQVKYAYSLSGGTFYTFDTDARILTKYVAWW